MKIKIGTLFSGIGAPEQGAKRVYGDNFELTFACEWDKYARESFKANYEIDDTHFHKDINDMDGYQYKDNVDILIGGSPCQDFSIAGLRAGVDGHRGQLIWQYYRIIKEAEPQIFIYENVKGMLSDNKENKKDKYGKTFADFLDVFRDLGYHLHHKVLNTKDYGVPQNRERIFIVGFKDKEHHSRFAFADKIVLEKRLNDVLEGNVDEKYYLSVNAEKYITDPQRLSKKFTSLNGEVSQTLMAQYSQSMAGTFLCVDSSGRIDGNNNIKVTSATKSGYEIAKIGDSINLTHPNSTTRRGRVGKEVAQTLDCACNQAVVEPILQQVGTLDIKGNDSIKRVYSSDELSHCLTTVGGGNREPKILEEDILNPLKGKTEFGWRFEQKVYDIESKCTRALTASNGSGSREKVIENYRIRKLTPRECFRLQDFPDDFKFVVSNSQLYKQAGNSMSVNVLEMIFKKIEESRFSL